MSKRRRCPYCRRLFVPDPRLKDRQRTCGRPACRREHKRRYDRRWRSRHPDYFRGSYPHQKQMYGTRAEYKRQYRQAHPEYVERNAARVRQRRERRRQAEGRGESHTSRDLTLRLWGKETCVEITRVSHTSREIFVSLSEQEACAAIAAGCPTSFDGAAGSGPLPSG